MVMVNLLGNKDGYNLFTNVWAASCVVITKILVHVITTAQALVNKLYPSLLIKSVSV